MEIVLFIISILVVALSIVVAIKLPSKVATTTASPRKSVKHNLGNNRGFVSPMEIGMFGEEAAYAAIDVSKLDVESFGRRRGAFGKWGYCVTKLINVSLGFSARMILSMSLCFSTCVLCLRGYTF